MPPPHSRQPPLSQLDARVLSAAGAGRPDLLEAVLAGGGSANAGPDFCGDSPLLLAARGMQRGHIECCRLLLAGGGDPNWQGSRGETAVMVAVQGGSEALLEVVLTPNANLALRTDGGLTSLQLSCLHRRPAMLARLLLHQRRQLAEAEADAPGQDGAAGGPQAAAAAAAGRQLVLAVYASVAGGEPRCLQELVSDPLTKAAYSTQFAPLGGPGSCSGTAGSSDGGGSSAAAALQQLQPPGSAPAGPLPPPPAVPQGLPVPHQQQRHWDREAEERLQEELSFLLDPEIVGAHNSRPASFLWQTSEPLRQYQQEALLCPHFPSCTFPAPQEKTHPHLLLPLLWAPQACCYPACYFNSTLTNCQHPHRPSASPPPSSCRRHARPPGCRAQPGRVPAHPALLWALPCG